VRDFIKAVSTNKKRWSRAIRTSRLRSLAFGQGATRLAYHPAAEKY